MRECKTKRGKNTKLICSTLEKQALLDFRYSIPRIEGLRTRFHVKEVHGETTKRQISEVPNSTQASTKSIKNWSRLPLL